VTKTEILKSPANPLLKEVRRAVLRGSLTREGDCVAEGFHLLDEALACGCPIGAVLAAESARPAVESHVGNRPGVRVVGVADALFRGFSSTETSQGVIVLVRPPAWELSALFRGPALVLVLDGVQDPGNAGAMLRAAEAFGATGAILVKGTVSPYNPKALRASAGSVFRLPLVAGIEAAQARAALEERGVAVYAAMPEGARALGEADLAHASALVIGSEGRGIGPQLRAGATELRIPVTGVESLNAAMAAGILLYEARRQRTAR
jgi:TrmH family RNA methyltransferase